MAPSKLASPLGVIDLVSLSILDSSILVLITLTLNDALSLPKSPTFTMF